MASIDWDVKTTRCARSELKIVRYIVVLFTIQVIAC